jgi:hypothetical protein
MVWNSLGKVECPVAKKKKEHVLLLLVKYSIHIGLYLQKTNNLKFREKDIYQKNNRHNYTDTDYNGYVTISNLKCNPLQTI